MYHILITEFVTSVCRDAGIRSLRHSLNTVLTRSRLGSCPFIPSIAILKELTFSCGNSKFNAAWIEPECPSSGAEEISVKKIINKLLILCKNMKSISGRHSTDTNKNLEDHGKHQARPAFQADPYLSQEIWYPLTSNFFLQKQSSLHN